MTQEAVQTVKKTKTVFQPPPRWNVVFYNDDSTPMDYVIQVLMSIFKHTADTAKEITLTIHNSGRGVAGNYPYEIAEQKAAETMTESRTRGYSLQVEIEQE
jgi:ATP-dependent Clp protease adaptor protein ClpS